MSDSDKKPDAKINALIDQNLKRMFSSLEDEPLPDRFKDLIAKLRAQDDEKPSGE